MNIAIDLRFARLPCGGRTYTGELAHHLLQLQTPDQWQFLFNPDCEYQRPLVHALQKKHPVQTALTFHEVTSPCLTLRQHAEFLRWQRRWEIYHYLHFDLPLGVKADAIILTIHDLYPLTLPGYCDAARKAYFKYLTRYNTHRAAAVISVSENTKKDLIACLNVPEEKIHVIPHGITPAFQPLPDRKCAEAVRRRYHLPERFILYTGTHKPHKNLSRLLQAFALLPAALRTEYPLVLTGPIDANTESLKQQAESLQLGAHVSFMGLVPFADLPPLYNLASLYVLPSLYEGFGFGPLEALACGTPVACSNTSAIPEVVGDAGRTFDPYEVEDMADVMQQALPAEQDMALARKKCLQRAALFSWERAARRTHDLYRRLHTEMKEICPDATRTVCREEPCA